MRPRAAALAFGMLAPLACAAGDIRLDAPLGGWHHSGGQAEAFMQAVNYPASGVNAPNLAATGSLIRGHVAEAPKDRRPLTLVVNGVALPQRVEDNGDFARPWAFAAGSNSVELRAPDGRRRRVQSYESYAGRSRPRLRVTLSWDSDGTDLDLHLITPGGEHVFYGHRAGADGTALDVDVTTGYGPEVIASPSPEPGTWLVYLNFYGSGPAEDGSEAPLTTAQVAIVTDEATPREKQQVFQVPLRKPGELLLVRQFRYP